jgi:type IV secretory pathway VirB9-like protein
MVALILTLATTLPGATKRNFQAGKLVSVTMDERFGWAVFTVQVGDLVYTARGGRVRRHSGDLGQGLIVGDAVQIALDGSEHLILLKPDGKELSTTIIQRARAQ